MIQIDKGIWVNPKLIAVVRDVGKGKCALFTAGQSSTDSFYVEREGFDVSEEISAALALDDEE